MFKAAAGKLVKTDGQGTESLLSGSAVYVVSNILNAAIPFFLLPVLTRYLTPAEYGLVGVFLLALTLLGAFTGLSMQGAANRRYFDGDDSIDLASYITCCVTVVVAAASIVLFVVYLCRTPLAELTGLNANWLLLAVLASAMGALCNICLGQWQVRKQSLYYGAFQISISLLNAGISLYLVVVLTLGVEGRLWGQTLALLLSGVAGLWFLYRSDRLALKWRLSYIRDALAFGIPLIPHICGLVMLTMLDRLVVMHYLGLPETGVYMVAVQLALGMSLLADAVNKAYVPWLFEKLSEQDTTTNRNIVRMTYAYFAVVLFLALLVALVAPLFVPWFAGKDYQEAGFLLRWLALGQAFHAMYLMVTNYIFYSRKTAYLSLATITVGIVHILLAIFLVQKYELNGVAMAYAASMAARFILTWYLAQRQCPMPWVSALTVQR